jgi:hypothetical protein
MDLFQISLAQSRRLVDLPQIHEKLPWSPKAPQ